MRTKIRKFLNIFRAELDELVEDLLIFEDLYKKREENGEITNYVYLENKGLIKDELLGVQNIVNSAEQLLDHEYQNLDEMVEDLSAKIKMQIEESGHSNAAFLLVERKLQKVKKYMMDET